jgi:hypothetical protein
MKNNMKLQNIENNRRGSGNYNYSNPNNYWQSFYAEQKSH